MGARAIVFRWAGLTMVFAVAAFALAGPLTPPTGPVSSTPGPEPRIPISASTTPGDADSVFRIVNPGSYYLTGNVAGQVGKHGIKIDLVQNGPSVTLDLMGFELVGVTGSISGVRVVSANTRGVAVRNGAIRNWGEYGMDLTSASSSHIEDIRAESNAFEGINVGANATIKDCVVSFNGGTGIFARANALVIGCRANNNADNGILLFGVGGNAVDCVTNFNSDNGIALSFGSAATNCTATTNGFSGFSLSAGATATNCLSMNNTSQGFVCTDDNKLTNCTARNNGQRGFSMGARALIQGCLSTDNGSEGIYILSEGTVVDSTISLNGAAGIRISEGGLVQNCLISMNAGHGVHAVPLDITGNNDGVTVAQCRVNRNGGHGILVHSESTISGNSVLDHAGATGIRAEGAYNLICDNFVASCDRGFEVLGVSNTIIRNIVRNSAPEYTILPNVDNTTGTIVNTEGAMNSAANGLVNLQR